MSDARKLELLTPQNSQVIFIDHQPQMAFGVQSIDRQVLKNNVVARLMSAFDPKRTLWVRQASAGNERGRGYLITCAISAVR